MVRSERCVAHTQRMPAGEWSDTEYAARYLARADGFPHRVEGESVLLDEVPLEVRRVLDLGAGDGRLLAMLRRDRPAMAGVALDASPAMLACARARFAGDAGIEVVDHDLAEPLPDLGGFDAVVSSMAIHHLADERKRALYAEAFAVLESGGVFANFEHVAAPTQRLHEAFYVAIGELLDHEDPSDQLSDVFDQLGWLREAGFEDVDCLWKWREMALLTGRRYGR